MIKRGNSFLIKVFPLLIFLNLSFSDCLAKDTSYYLEKADSLSLADDPFWKKLLHFKSGRSQILDSDFFLSQYGSTDLRLELEATINAYFARNDTIEKKSVDTDILCTFPARFTWLNDKLQLPDFSIDDDNCPTLIRWAKLDEIDSVSLLYVGSYLGNPASSFGHVLLNLKVEGQEGLEGLLDTSISYGATVPINENIAVYVLKGLFGGYYSTFTDKYYYAHDQVYSNREARDMWEYRLILDDKRKKLLIYHIAELLTKRNRYFFLSANCAQRVAVLLDIFIPENVYPINYPVYLPEELIHRLQHLDKKRRLNGEVGLIETVTFIPSARRELYYKIHQLTEDEKIAYDYVRKDLGNSFSSLDKLNTESQIRILNALLSYRYYILISKEESASNYKLIEFKNRILLKRLQLPVQQYEHPDIKEIPSPLQISPPSAFSFGVLKADRKKLFYTFGLSVYRKESVGLNALEFNELVALNLNLGVKDESNKLFIDSFDLLRVRDFKTIFIKNENERPFSWRFRAGVDRISSQNYDGVLDGGIGFVNKPSSFGIVYGFINLSLHTQKHHFRAGPLIGAVFGNDKIKFQTDGGFNYIIKSSSWKRLLKTKLQYQFNKEIALQLIYEKLSRERSGITVIYYW